MFLVCLALLERVAWQGKFDLGTRWGHAKRLSFEAAAAENQISIYSHEFQIPKLISWINIKILQGLECNLWNIQTQI